MTIGKPVHLNMKFVGIENMNGKIYLLGLHIGNKNTTTIKKLKQAFKNLKFEEKMENENNEYINKYVKYEISWRIWKEK
jgi:hypothetical protein